MDVLDLVQRYDNMPSRQVNNFLTRSKHQEIELVTRALSKYSEAAILVFALDNPDSFHVLSQHLLDIVTYAENAKIFL